MAFDFDLIDYKKDLNARQKENYNFQKISAVLADYGFVTIRLSDDWNGADFIALHISGKYLRVQLKARLSFSRKYEAQPDLYIAFPFNGEWYLYKHGELLQKVLATTTIAKTESWSVRGGYSRGGLGGPFLALLEPYRLLSKGTSGISDAVGLKRSRKRRTR